MRKEIPVPQITFYDLPGTSVHKDEIEPLLQDWFEQEDFSVSTQHCYQSELKRFHVWLSKPLTQVTDDDLSSYREYLSQRNLSRRSINTAEKRIKRFLGWLNTISD